MFFFFNLKHNRKKFLIAKQSQWLFYNTTSWYGLLFILISFYIFMFDAADVSYQFINLLVLYRAIDNLYSEKEKKSLLGSLVQVKSTSIITFHSKIQAEITSIIMFKGGTLKKSEGTWKILPGKNYILSWITILLISYWKLSHIPKTYIKIKSWFWRTKIMFYGELGDRTLGYRWTREPFSLNYSMIHPSLLFYPSSCYCQQGRESFTQLMQCS